MRLLRMGAEGSVRPDVLDDAGGYRDLSRLTPDIDGAFLSGDGPARARDALATLPEFDATGLRAAEPPAEPVVFVKVGNTVVGPDDEVLIPRGLLSAPYADVLALIAGLNSGERGRVLGGTAVATYGLEG